MAAISLAMTTGYLSPETGTKAMATASTLLGIGPCRNLVRSRRPAHSHPLFPSPPRGVFSQDRGNWLPLLCVKKLTQSQDERSRHHQQTLSAGTGALLIWGHAAATLIPWT
jgi:hypothetical protein